MSGVTRDVQTPQARMGGHGRGNESATHVWRIRFRTAMPVVMFAEMPMRSSGLVEYSVSVRMLFICDDMSLEYSLRARVE